MNIEQIPKPHIADADPVKLWGRLPLSGKRALSAPAGSAGVLVTACAPGRPVATRETQRRGESREAHLQPVTREGRNGAQLGVGEAHSTDGSRVTPVEGRGLGLGTGRSDSREIGESLSTPSIEMKCGGRLEHGGGIPERKLL